MSDIHPYVLTQESARRYRACPIDHVRLTNPQRQFAGIVQRLALWRGANQIGKSHGLAYDIIHTARGTHPDRPVHKPPVRLLVIGESWAQMDPLCLKLNDMLPKDEIDPRVRYEPGGGFRGFKEPRIPFVSGPGAGSVIIFATYKQGSKRVAGGSFHGAYCDEPPPETVLGEVMPRLSRFHGFLRIAMTPTPESPPLQYLRDMLEKDAKKPAGRRLWRELQTSLSLDALTVRGGLVQVPWKSKREMEELIESYLEVEREMRTTGAWDPVIVGRWITAFTDAHVWKGELADELRPGERVYVAVGIDHGAKAGRQVAELVVCSEDGTRVWFLDEAWSDGRTSVEEDAKNILAMLRRHGWTWKDVDYWVGDRAHGGDADGNEKSNTDLLHAFSRELQIPVTKLVHGGLRIAQPKKFNGSLFRGLRLMNSLFKQGQAKVHARCQGIIRGSKEWKGRKDDPLKDPLDAGRYPVEVLHDALILRPRIAAAGAIY